MRHAFALLVLAARTLAGLAFLTLMAAVVVQLLGRSGYVPTVVWSEELTRFAMLYLVAFGAGLAFRSGDMVNVDILSEALPGHWPWRLRLAAATLTAVLCLGLLPGAWRYTAIGVRQTSPALGVRMDLIHASVLVALAMIGLFAALRVIAMLRGIETGLPNRIDEDE